MKKVLFATTALVASAGFAYADVSLSGSAQMGVQGGEEFDADVPGIVDQETQFVQDIDVTFTLSGETDGGLTFGAAVDLDESAGSVGTDDAGVAIFISGDFGTLTMGDTDGALDAAMQDPNVTAGSINDDETSHVGLVNSYLDGAYDGQILSYSYTVAGFTIIGSIEMDDTGARDNGYAIGARYTGDFGGGSYTVGAGYQVATPRDSWMLGNFNASAFDFAIGGDGIDSDTDGDGVESIAMGEAIGEVTATGISGSVALDAGLTVTAAYTMYEATGNDLGVEGVSFDATHMAIGASYTFDAITVAANYGTVEIDNLGDFYGYGLSAAYDLGGGLSVHAGYGLSDYDYNGSVVINDVDGSIATWSLGVAMSF
ncbi:porin [Rhodobacterales bacterium HKCCE4037]|nr:porin [Rhodobacterales bacterium HKCCE4037]